jgi:hypothetical protein
MRTRQLLRPLAGFSLRVLRFMLRRFAGCALKSLKPRGNYAQQAQHVNG